MYRAHVSVPVTLNSPIVPYIAILTLRSQVLQFTRRQKL